jgi:hypothetical protein
MSSPQDLCDGSHESAKGRGKGIDLREGEGVDRGWAESLGTVVVVVVVDVDDDDDHNDGGDHDDDDDHDDGGDHDDDDDHDDGGDHDDDDVKVIGLQLGSKLQNLSQY